MTMMVNDMMNNMRKRHNNDYGNADLITMKYDDDDYDNHDSTMLKIKDKNEYG